MLPLACLTLHTMKEVRGSKSADLNRVRPQLGALCPGTGPSSLLASCSSSAPCGDSICLKGPRKVSQEWSMWTWTITLETPVAATMLTATSLQASPALAPICDSVHPVTQESRCFPLYRWAEASKVSNLTSGLKASSKEAWESSHWWNQWAVYSLQKIDGHGSQSRADTFTERPTSGQCLLPWFFDFSKIKYSVESWAWSSSCCWPQFSKLAFPYSVSWRRWLVFHITWYRFPHSRTLLVTQAGLKTNGYDLNKILPVLCILYIGYVSLYTVALCRQCSYLFSLSQIKDLIMRTSV